MQPPPALHFSPAMHALPDVHFIAHAPTGRQMPELPHSLEVRHGAPYVHETKTRAAKTTRASRMRDIGCNGRAALCAHDYGPVAVKRAGACARSLTTAVLR